jgi:hypothetical protein
MGAGSLVTVLPSKVQPSKAPMPTKLMVAGSANVASAEQLRNAPSRMVVSFVDGAHSTEASETQPAKALFSSSSRPAGSVTLASLTHEKNAMAPIAVRVAGRFTSASEEHPANAPRPMALRPSGRATVCRAEPAKAWLPMALSCLGSVTAVS